ncbi:MAG: methylated-DNA--[protein]-cysteine S-methyltransferase [Gemmatimonadales bacterium]|jgi:AraC family transcriptional regulator of adaptative response/methylated-DNA-[protein]-cysteine methyltransferase
MTTLTSKTADAERVARAIGYLERHYRQQPSLEVVADHVGLSPHHFQRIFKRWAGVTPKRFVQFLTVEHAKRALRDGRTVLDAAYDAGLSGPGRLHDLFVSVEAVTPGQFRASGSGLVLRWGVVPSPFGRCIVAVTDRGVARLAFVGDAAESVARDDLAVTWPGAVLAHDPDRVWSVAETIFARGPSETRPLTLVLRGTNFQLQVWQALLRVPPGALVSYGDVARAVGRPAAVRAVASAVARNPIAYLIPCHRVIRSTGAFGDYRWGAERKVAMIGWEAARHG